MACLCFFKQKRSSFIVCGCSIVIVERIPHLHRASESVIESAQERLTYSTSESLSSSRVGCRLPLVVVVAAAAAPPAAVVRVLDVPLLSSRDIGCLGNICTFAGELLNCPADLLLGDAEYIDEFAGGDVASAAVSAKVAERTG